VFVILSIAIGEDAKVVVPLAPVTWLVDENS
jgi:hypothetical protein